MKGMAAATVPAVPAMPLAAASGCPSRTLSSACARPTSGALSAGIPVYMGPAAAGSAAAATGTAWPPPLTSGTPKAAPFARSNLITTSKRSNAITQATCTGHPLHCFAGDTTAGDTNGEESSASGATVVRRKRIRQQGRPRSIGDR